MGIWSQAHRPIAYALFDRFLTEASCSESVRSPGQFTSDRNLKYTDRRGGFHHFPIVGEITTEADGIHVTLLIDAFRWTVRGPWIESENCGINLVSAEVRARSARSDTLLEVAAVIPADEFPEFNCTRWTLCIAQRKVKIRHAIRRAICEFTNISVSTNFWNNTGLFEFSIFDTVEWTIANGMLVHRPTKAKFELLEYSINSRPMETQIISVKIHIHNILFRLCNVGDLSPIYGHPLAAAAEFIEFETHGQNRRWRPNARDGLRDPMPPRIVHEGYGLSFYGMGDMPDIAPFKSTRKIPEIETQCQGCRNYHGQTWGGNRLVCGMYPMGNESQCSDFEPKPDELARH